MGCIAASSPLLAALLLLPLTAEAGLPRIAISIPANQALAEGLLAAEHCDVPGKIMVLSPVSFDFASDEAPSPLDEQAVASIPQGVEAWLHVVLGAASHTGKGSEGEINERVDALVKSLPLSAIAVHGLVVEIKSQAADDLFAYGLIRLALGVKGNNASLRLAFVFPPGFIGSHADIVRRLATYSDLLGTTYSQGWRQEATWISEHALNKPIILKSDTGALATTSPFLAAILDAGPSVEIAWAEPPDAKAAAAMCATSSFLNRTITNSMYPMDSSTSSFNTVVDGVRNDEHHWLAPGAAAEVIVAHVNASPDSPKSVQLQGFQPGAFEIKWFDPATGLQLQAGDVTKADQGPARTCVYTSEYALVSIRRQSEAGPTVSNIVEVKSGVELSVEEIIARWQQNREAQKQRLQNYLASSFMSLHFETTNLEPGFDFSMEFEQFFSRDGAMELAQKAFYINGVKYGRNHEFPLPEIEPEKVMTQPLELKLNERYKYKLLGTEQINGATCFVVGVEPKVQDEALYSGKIWIEGATFREVKQYLTQRGVKSNVLVNVETQNYELVRDENGNQFNLLRSISAQQLLNAAGRDFVLQRTVQFSDYIINTPRFSTALAAEHSSDDPMYRDTDHGLRPLRKKSGERVLIDQNAKRVKALVSGLMYGGTFNFPIPFLGASTVDFDFHHTGAQLSTFFAGPILITDLSKQFQPKFRLALDLALTGVPGQNRIYSNDTELLQGQVWTWEQTTGLRVSWQATTHLSVTASNYFAYDNFLRTSQADEHYQLPRNGLNVLPGLEMKYSRHGYVFNVQGTRGERIGWRPFGCGSLSQSTAGCASLSLNPPLGNVLLMQHPQNAFTLYNADLYKDYYIRKFTKGGWDVSYWGGNQLDRFSRYFPSFLTTPRLHGIPPGTDSFDALAMANVHYGFNVMDLVKVEGMYAYARARNLEESLRFRKFDGLELNFNTPGPFGTLLQGTVSYALDGNIPRYNSRWALYILMFKPR